MQSSAEWHKESGLWVPMKYRCVKRVAGYGKGNHRKWLAIWNKSMGAWCETAEIDSKGIRRKQEKKRNWETKVNM